VTFGGKELDNWKMYGFPFNTVNSIKYTNKPSSTQSHPSLYRGVFQLQKTGDTYLDMSAWGKGVVWINGHNLGRYWNIGSQQTFYVPVEWLKKGDNEIVVFELFQRGSDLSSLEKPILDKLK